jgi:hypothetical protein
MDYEAKTIARRASSLLASSIEVAECGASTTAGVGRAARVLGFAYGLIAYVRWAAVVGNAVKRNFILQQGFEGPRSRVLRSPVCGACISTQDRAHRGRCRNSVPITSRLRGPLRPSLVECPVSETESVQCAVQQDHRQATGDVSPWPFPGAAARRGNGGRGTNNNGKHHPERGTRYPPCDGHAQPPAAR